MEYTWNCKNVEVYATVEINGVTHSDVVHTVNWELTATEGDISFSHIGFTNLDITNLSTFTAYSDLTNDTVASWIESIIGTAEVESIKAALSRLVAESRIIVSGSESRILP